MPRLAAGLHSRSMPAGKTKLLDTVLDTNQEVYPVRNQAVRQKKWAPSTRFFTPIPTTYRSAETPFFSLFRPSSKRFLGVEAHGAFEEACRSR